MSMPWYTEDAPSTGGLLGDYAIPLEERRRLLLANALLGLGAGLGNARKGQELGGAAQGLARGGIAGQEAVMQAMRERGMSLTQQAQAEKMRREAALLARQEKWMSGGDEAQTFAPGGTVANAMTNGMPPQGGATAPAQGNTTYRAFMAQAKALGIEQPVQAALMSDKGSGEGFRAAAKMIADAAKPQSVSPGQTMWNPTTNAPQFSAPYITPGQEAVPGGGVRNIPGSVEADAQRTGAVEGAKAGYDLVQVPQSDGTMKMMPRAAAVQAMQPQPPRVNMDRQPTAQEAAWIAANGGPQLGVTQNPLTKLQGETDIATQGAQDRTIAEAQAKDFVNLQEGARTAGGTISKLNLLKNHLAKVDTGKPAPTVQTLKAYAAYVAPELAKGWTTETPYAQAAAALGNEMTLQLRNPATGPGMPGSLSDRDLSFLQSMTASAANDPRAIPMIIDAQIAIHTRTQEVAKMAREYRKANGKIDDGFYSAVSEYANTHPLFPEAPQQQRPAGGTKAPLSAAERAELEKLKKQLGMN